MKLETHFYTRKILEKGRETLLWSFIAFSAAVILSRLIVLDVERGRKIFGYFYIKGYHIHHFYYGIILLIISNWLSLIHYRNLHKRLFRGIASTLFGGGLGLVMDEFGLLLTMEFGLKGNYWAPQSYYAMGITASIFVILIILVNAD